MKSRPLKSVNSCLIFLFFILSSCNKHGTHSDKLIGSWWGISEWESNGGYTAITTETTIELQKSGNGNLLYNVSSETSGKIDYSYIIKFKINWMTRTNGTEDFLIF